MRGGGEDFGFGLRLLLGGGRDPPDAGLGEGTGLDPPDGLGVGLEVGVGTGLGVGIMGVGLHCGAEHREGKLRQVEVVGAGIGAAHGDGKRACMHDDGDLNYKCGMINDRVAFKVRE